VLTQPPPPVPILRQVNLVHTFSPCFPKIHSNIILSTPRSFEWSRPFRFSKQSIVCISYLSHTCYMPRSSHPPRLHHPNIVWWSLQVMTLLIVEPSPSSWNVFPLRSRYSPQHLFTNTPSVRAKFHTHTIQEVKLWFPNTKNKVPLSDDSDWLGCTYVDKICRNVSNKLLCIFYEIRLKVAHFANNDLMSYYYQQYFICFTQADWSHLYVWYSTEE
jgi:hypothetical protein